jgi:pyridoxal phosphate enzyme (YggS family)
MNISDTLDSAISAQATTLQEHIRKACARVKRSPAEVTTVAVTKSFPAEIVRKACALAFTHIGENRVQELIEKFQDGCLLQDYPNTFVHLIGHLQSNKVRKAVQFAATVDSVDSTELARSLDLHAASAGKRLRVLVEINTSHEPQKYGIKPEKSLEAVERMLQFKNLNVAGFMTVGPNVDDETEVRASFKLLRETFENVRNKLNPPYWKVLSMGMSGDYEIAIEEGATEIRVGTALFGSRRSV